MGPLYNTLLIHSKSYAFVAVVGCILIFAGCSHPASASRLDISPAPATENPSLTDGVENTVPTRNDPTTTDTKKTARKILFIGDSMTGWMGERLNAWGDVNGFEVATVVWDGSTIKKWANTEALKKIISEKNPDAVMLSLGMNDLFAPNPDAMYSASVDKIISAIGQRPFLWVGPPSWPGHNEGRKFTSWIAGKVGESRFYDSLDLQLPRQSRTNPHPTRSGIEKWIDTIVEWIPANAEFTIPTESTPASGKMTRGKYFLYKGMKEKL